MYCWSDIWEVSEGLWEAPGASGRHPGASGRHFDAYGRHFGGICEAWELARGTPDPATLPSGWENVTPRVPTATNQIAARLQDYKLHNNNATRL